MSGERAAHPPGTQDHRVGRVEVELGRVTTRLSGLGPARLVRPGSTAVGAEVVAPGPSASPVELVRPLVQHLADLVATAEGAPRREVPQLAAHAAGDQLVVLVRDVLALPQDPAAAERLDDVADRLEALRRALP